MQEPEIHINIYDLRLWKRFFRVSGLYWFSERKWQAWGMLGLLLLLMAAHPLLIKRGMFIGKEVTDTLTSMQLQGFYHALLLMLPVIAAIVLLESFKNYVWKLLNINWQLWLTGSLLGSYFTHRAYYRISSDHAIDNPDQRLSVSIERYTSTSIDYLMTIAQSLFSFAVFSVTLWQLSPKLLGTVLLYVSFFALVTSGLNRRLGRLNFQVQQRKAEFRHGMVHLRDNTESIAFFRGEQTEKKQLAQRLVRYITCNLSLIGLERNLGCITQTFQLLPMLLPGLVLAPNYFAGTLTYGDLILGQAAFQAVLNALNGIADKLDELNRLAASFTRVDELVVALEKSTDREAWTKPPFIEIQEGSDIRLDHVSLQTPDHQRTLLHDATARLTPGRGLLIAGASGAGKSSLLRAIAGLWNAGTGEITRPPLREMMFLPQRPYMIQGTLCEQLLYPNQTKAVTDSELQGALRSVNLADLAERFEGFETEKDWATILSLGEQQRISFARLLLTKPRYAILDEATSALDVANESNLYKQLQQSAMTYVSVGHRPSLFAFHDELLELTGKGAWRLRPSPGSQSAEIS